MIPEKVLKRLESEVEDFYPQTIIKTISLPSGMLIVAELVIVKLNKENAVE
jgi:hypothetical protein